MSFQQAVDDPKKNVMELMRPGADPIVMMAWRCKFLEEIVIHGYVMDPYNLVGVSRLLGRNLKRLEVSMIDSVPISGIMESFIEVRFHNCLKSNCLKHNNKQKLQEVSTQLAQKWLPMDCHEMHPSLGSMPVCDDVHDEYVLNLLRSDLSD